MENYELYHHGIKGMKWGVRRYQNKDGSLTAAGKKHYYNNDGSLTAAGKKDLTVFGTAKPFYVKTKTGEILTIDPKKSRSFVQKLMLDKDMDMGYRGEANYDIKKSDGKTIGELSLMSKRSGYNKDTAYADWITIDKVERGKGYATSVLEEVLVKANDAGYSKMALNALKEPRPLYERMGFEYVDKSKKNLVDQIRSFEVGCKPMEYDLKRLKK